MKKHLKMRTVKRQKEFIRTTIPRIYSLNLQHALFDRESGFTRRNWRCKTPTWHYTHERQFYRSIRPNLTVSNVNRPSHYLRKFSPDGKYLFGFCNDLRSIVLYTYTGVAKTYLLTDKIRYEHTSANDGRFNDLRRNLFNTLFRFNIKIQIVSHFRRGVLHRDFSIFMNNGKYVLIASPIAALEPLSPTFGIDYPDSDPNMDINNITFFLLDLKTFRVTDEYTLLKDNITLAHNHGVSVYENTIVILSNLRQCITILQVNDGKFKYLYELGPYSDILSSDSVRQMVSADRSAPNPSGVLPFTHLKQKIITHIYYKVLHATTKRVLAKRLKEFYANFNRYDKMFLCQVQIIDEYTLLLRYETRDLIYMDGIFKLLVFYCLKKQCVIALFEQNSPEMDVYMRRHFENFNKTFSTHGYHHPTSGISYEHFRYHLETVLNSSEAGLSGAAQMLNAGLLPISTQTLATIPYFDYSHYIYTERYISQLESPKLRTQESIQFFDRHLLKLSFSIYLETYLRNADDFSLVSIQFHPYEPLAVSFQKSGSSLFINFHLHNPNTIVRSCFTK